LCLTLQEELKENRVLRKISDLNRVEVVRKWKINYIMKSSIIHALHRILLG
jgi:hypothetical protein